MNRILITGAGGVVGQALTRALLEEGLDVVALQGRRDCNLEDPVETDELFKKYSPQFVYHLAGAVYGLGGNLAFPGDVFRRNILINTNVVESCRNHDVQKIVAMGSAAVYSDGLEQPMKEIDALSGEPHRSEFGYAFAKRALLVQLQSYKDQFGLRFSFAIATNMYGPGDRFDPSHGHVVPSLIYKFHEASRSGGKVEVWGDGSPTRDFLYSRDAAKALRILMEKGDGAYNVASGLSHRISDLVAIISSRFPEVDIVWDKTKPMGQMKRTYDVTRLKSLGFVPLFDLKTGIAETIDWFISKDTEKR